MTYVDKGTIKANFDRCTMSMNDLVTMRKNSRLADEENLFVYCDSCGIVARVFDEGARTDAQQTTYPLLPAGWRSNGMLHLCGSCAEGSSPHGRLS